MSLKRVFCAAVSVCLALPAWAVTAPATKTTPLSIAAGPAAQIDPALQIFIQQVWAESPALQKAQAELEAARAHAAGADKPLHNPVLELETERTEINTTTVGVSQTLDWSDKRDAASRIAAREVEAAQAQRDQARQRVAIDALNALADYYSAGEMQALALRRSQLMKGFIDVIDKRQAAGDVTALEANLAQVAYSEALMAQANSESALAEAEAALQAASGLAPPQWPGLPDRLSPPPEQADIAQLDALPELVALKKRLQAATARIDLARREGRIDPTVGLRAGREDSETLLGVTLEIPLFVRNNFQSGVRAAGRNAAAEEQAYRQAHRLAVGRLRAALGRYHHTSRAWRAWVSTGLQAHREQAALLERMWRAGELSATDFLVQAKQNIDTQVSATRLKGEVWQAFFEWLDATGQVEQWLGLTPESASRTNTFGAQQ
ncbi:hypothetical protein Tel_06390 [Candidatus Tenderia electrophaga]|uniref:Transporter n=1 Tax=Candidatus Tenderia electrophaga TaxID=1748243 RepID=A0A0S2TCC5_9GAMM|nr:hypothetical protein Tel_06390 [Candidatus Tenderia electrophaga]